MQHRVPCNELSESPNITLPPPNNEDKVDEILAREEDANKEDEELSLYWVIVGNSKDTPIKANSHEP